MRIKLLKNLPVVGLVLYVIFTSFANLTFQSTTAPSSTFNLISMVIGFSCLGLILVPSIVLFCLLATNKKFRNDLLSSEVNANDCDEREEHISAEAGKRAFAAMHFALLMLLILFIPLQFILTMLPSSFMNLAYNLPGGTTLFYFMIPLIVGNFTFHRSVQSLNIGSNARTRVAATNVGKERSLPVGLLLMGLILGLVIGYSSPKQSNVNAEPKSIREINSTYRNNLKIMSEDRAQETLIEMLKNQAEIFDVKRTSDVKYPGIYIDYCNSNGTKAALGNSWENMKNY